jgi:hypothetical protein
MPAAVRTPQAGFRIVSRRPANGVVKVTMRAARPAILDLRLRGDPWVALERGGRARVYFGGVLLTSCNATAFDVPALNSQLLVFRNRLPRQKR